MKPAAILLLSAMGCTTVFGQSAGAFNASPGVDLTGQWAPAPHEENVGNPTLADYLGVPITDGARAGNLPCGQGVDAEGHPRLLARVGRRGRPGVVRSGDDDGGALRTADGSAR